MMILKSRSRKMKKDELFFLTHYMDWLKPEQKVCPILLIPHTLHSFEWSHLNYEKNVQDQWTNIYINFKWNTWTVYCPIKNTRDGVLSVDMLLFLITSFLIFALV